MDYESPAEGVLRIEIPLPDTPLKATNAYLIRDGDRSLWIDTGFNHPLCRDALRRAWRDLDIDPARTDLFVTHMHGDHAGLVDEFACGGSRVYMSEADGRMVADPRNPAYWEPLRNFLRFSGLLAVGVDDNVECHPGYTLSPEPGAAIAHVRDGDAVRIGSRRFVAVATKGHTAGHMCLHEPDTGILFSGDHILGRITPNITLVKPDGDVLADYLGSLDRILALDVRMALPGHRRPIADCHGRIAELREHHRRRLGEVEAILAEGGKGVVDVTRRMRWSLSYSDWDQYPPAQKLFSAGEAFAHLHHLVCLGKARMRWEDELAVFYADHG